MLPLIESAIGLWNARAIAEAPGVLRLAFGSIDFQVDLGMSDDDLVAYRAAIVLASRVAGRIAPVDGVTTSIDDAALVRRDAERARALGFGGKLCIHPAQVATVNAAFQPTDTKSPGPSASSRPTPPRRARPSRSTAGWSIVRYCCRRERFFPRPGGCRAADRRVVPDYV